MPRKFEILNSFIERCQQNDCNSDSFCNQLYAKTNVSPTERVF